MLIKKIIIYLKFGAGNICYLTMLQLLEDTIDAKKKNSLWIMQVLLLNYGYIKAMT